MQTGRVFEPQSVQPDEQTCSSPRPPVQSPQAESDRSNEPVFSPHPHQNASQPPSKEKKGTRWTDAVWTLPLKILAFREVVGQGWFSLTAQIGEGPNPQIGDLIMYFFFVAQTPPTPRTPHF